MVLQERDYTKFISEEEKSAFELEPQIVGRKGIKNNREFPRFSHPDEAVREFIWHKRSLFPNNYLHLFEYKKLDCKKIKTSVIPYNEMKNIMNVIDTDQCFRWFIEQTKEARFMPS